MINKCIYCTERIYIGHNTTPGLQNCKSRYEKFEFENSVVKMKSTTIEILNFPFCLEWLFIFYYDFSDWL